MQEHRYDPGHWVTQWNSSGRLDPLRESMRKAHFSCFYRTLALFGLIAPFPIRIFVNIRFSLPHAWIWCTFTLTALFLALWHFIKRSMIGGLL